ncbi:MAG: hypothetical protein QM645_13315, partial [Asticcacaulis sp.]
LVNFDQARGGIIADYITTQAVQIGTQIVPATRAPDHPTCLAAVPSVACAPREVAVYRYDEILNEGSSRTVNGRKSKSDLDTQSLRIGLNYRF